MHPVDFTYLSKVVPLVQQASGHDKRSQAVECNVGQLLVELQHIM